MHPRLLYKTVATFLLCSAASNSLLCSNTLASTSQLPPADLPSFRTPTPPSLSQPEDPCRVSVSSGDLSVGVSAMTDQACETGGLGCFSRLCRFCRLFDTTQSASFIACDAIALSVPPTFLPPTISPAFHLQCSATVSQGDASNGIDLVTDISCVQGGVGCASDVCRFCQMWPTSESVSFIRCEDVDTNNGSDIVFTPLPPNVKTNKIVIVSKDRPMLDIILFGTGPTTPAGRATDAAADACAQTVSKGDLAVGISAVSDRSCAFGGLGCFSAACRFCRLYDTPQSSPMLACASL